MTQLPTKHSQSMKLKWASCLGSPTTREMGVNSTTHRDNHFDDGISEEFESLVVRARIQLEVGTISKNYWPINWSYFVEH